MTHFPSCPLLCRQQQPPIEPEPDFAADELRAHELGLEGDHLYRLFVGWVPKLFTEADLKPLFQQVRGAPCLTCLCTQPGMQQEAWRWQWCCFKLLPEPPVHWTALLVLHVPLKSHFPGRTSLLSLSVVR